LLLCKDDFSGSRDLEVYIIYMPHAAAIAATANAAGRYLVSDDVSAIFGRVAQWFTKAK